MISKELLWNICVFLVATVVPPLLIGAYFFIRRPSQSPQEFIFGKYELHFVIVGLSLAAFVSTPFVLLLPIEVLYSGTTWIVGLVGFFIAAIIVAVFHVPPLHYSRATSLYQYVEDRYRSRGLRYFLLFWHIVTNVCYCIVILTLTTLFAKQILPIDKWMCSAGLTVLAVIGAISGGQKASVYLSTFVFCFEAIASLFCVAVAGLMNERSWTSVNSSDHLLPNYAPTSIFDLNIWLVLVYSIVFVLTFFGSNQISHQHYCSLQTKRRVRLSLFVCLLSFCLTWLLCCAVGLLLWQYYWNSCPFLPMTITSVIDVIKVFYNDTFAYSPGFLGYLIGSLVTLIYSTLPTALTSLAACSWEDLVKLYCLNAKEHWHVSILRLLMLFYACLISLISFVVLELVSDVWLYIKNVLFIVSSMSAPMGALFLMAVLLPCTNRKGVSVGLIIGLCTSVVLTVGSMIYNPRSYDISSSTVNHHLCCTTWRNMNSLESFNETSFNSGDSLSTKLLCSTVTRQSPEDDDSNLLLLDAFVLFKLPLILHPVICFGVTFVFGLLFSFLTGGQDIYALDWNLVYFTCNEVTSKCQCCKSSSKRRRKRSHLASAYATSDSFRYSRQGPFPDNSYHNPNVQTYLDTLSKT